MEEVDAVDLVHVTVLDVIVGIFRDASNVRPNEGSNTKTTSFQPTTITLLPTRLRQHAIDLIFVLQLEHLRGSVRVNALAVQQEAETRRLDSLARGVVVKDLLQLRRLLDLEEGFFSGLRKR